MSTGEQGSLLFRFLTEVGIIDQLARARLESVLPDGMRISQFIVLNHLVRLGGEWSPARLANAFQVTKGAMTNTLRRLESRRLVEIVSDPGDGRSKLVSLTAAGHAVREQCIRNVEPLLNEITAAVDYKRLTEALPLLKEVRKYLDEHRA